MINIEINKHCNINHLYVDFKYINTSGDFRKLLKIIYEKYIDLDKQDIINITELLNGDYNDFIKWIIENDIEDLNFYKKK